MKRQQHQRLLVEKVFTEICLQIADLMTRFGGPKMRAKLADRFNKEAEACGRRLTMEDGLVLIPDQSVDLQGYRGQLSTIIHHAVQVCGDKTVAAEIQKAVQRVQAETGVNLLETNFRLNIQDYTNKQ